MALSIEKQNNKFRVKTQDFQTQWLPDSIVNRKAVLVMLRYMCNEEEKHLFKFRELTKLTESEDRQAASRYVEHFRECSEDFLQFLTRKKKVNNEMVESTKKIIKKYPLIKEESLAKMVGEKLGRTDISRQNIHAALEQINCVDIRRQLRKRISEGKAHYRESYLLEELMQGNKELGREAGLNCIATHTDLKLVDPTAVRKLVTPNVPISEVSPNLAWMAVIINLYYWNVPLRTLGIWFNVNKTTILRWIASLALALWPIISGWILQRVKAGKLYLDEKWIKIRGKWYYWFVALDCSTNLPLFCHLSATRTRWATRFFVQQLSKLGKIPRVFITDGMLSYRNLFANAKHILCRFHYQRDITLWLKKHFSDPDEIEIRKKAMKKVLMTNDKRTVRRRLAKLESKAESWGISSWIEELKNNLPHLILSIGSRRFPSTTNAIERFFRSFNRFYKNRRNFHSPSSAKIQLVIFLVCYLFSKQDNGLAPIEKIFPEASSMPLYQLFNNPFFSLSQLRNVNLQPQMADFLISVSFIAQRQ